MLYTPAGVFALYPCNTTTIQDGRFEAILTKFSISTYTHDKKFDPIVLYFYKLCDNTAPSGDGLASMTLNCV